MEMINHRIHRFRHRGKARLTANSIASFCKVEMPRRGGLIIEIAVIVKEAPKEPP
jgi:hypothetical protein